MNPHNPANPKSLTASEYVLALFAPSDNVAILIRHRHLGHTLQRITKAEVIAAPEFQSVLLEQNQAGADIFIGMNPIRVCRSYKSFMRVLAMPSFTSASSFSATTVSLG